MNASVFAAGVVANALKSKSNLWYWRGAKTGIVWVATTFMRHTFLVSLHSHFIYDIYFAVVIELFILFLYLFYGRLLCHKMTECNSLGFDVL
jgi:hypothetical protein